MIFHGFFLLSANIKTNHAKFDILRKWKNKMNWKEPPMISGWLCIKTWKSSTTKKNHEVFRFKCEQLKDQSKQFRKIMYQNTQCVSSVGHHSLDPAQPALVSVGPLSVVVQVDMSLKSNLTYTLLTKKSIKMWIVKWSAVLPF